MSMNHPHVNRANDAPPEEVIKPPSTFGSFELDEAVMESNQKSEASRKFKCKLIQLRASNSWYQDNLITHLWEVTMG